MLLLFSPESVKLRPDAFFSLKISFAENIVELVFSELIRSDILAPVGKLRYSRSKVIEGSKHCFSYVVYPFGR